MDKLKQLKELLKDLSPEEMEQIRVFLSSDEVEDNSNAEVKNVSNDTEVNDSVEENIKEPQTEESSEESISTEETQEETEPETEESAEEVKDEVSTEEVVEQEEQSENIEDDDIPKMQKGIQTVNEESEVSNVTTDEGEELPVDYEKIIEGLNAKNAALEAENKALKAKVEGAFGYSAKPSTPAKVNRLYDDAADDIHFHK